MWPVSFSQSGRTAPCALSVHALDLNSDALAVPPDDGHSCVFLLGFRENLRKTNAMEDDTAVPPPLMRRDDQMALRAIVHFISPPFDSPHRWGFRTI